MEQQNRPKQKPAFFTVRAIVAFLILAALIAGIYLVGFRSWREVAEWGADSNHEILIYEEESYALIGVMKDKGDLAFEKYPIHKVKGQVKQDGTLMTTAEETLPPDALEGETLAVTPPDGTPTVPHEHTYIVYSVEKKEDYLIVLEKDGGYYLYEKIVETETETETET